MYYLHIYNSEKEEGSIVLPFEDMQPMINFVVDQYQKTIKRLKTNNKKYQKITSTWDKNKYDETLEESIKNFEFGIFCSMEITICYELTPEYNEEKHSEKTKRTGKQSAYKLCEAGGKTGGEQYRDPECTKKDQVAVWTEIWIMVCRE